MTQMRRELRLSGRPSVAARFPRKVFLSNNGRPRRAAPKVAATTFMTSGLTHYRWRTADGCGNWLDSRAITEILARQIP